MRQQWRHSVSDLRVLLSSVSRKNIVVGKGLEPGCLPHGQAPALTRVIVDIVVPVLGNVSHHRCGRFVPDLHTEPIVERNGP